MKKVLLLILVVWFSHGYTISYVMKPGEEATLASCDHLTDAEQAFARNLSALHRDLFCKRFCEGQRIQAMGIANEMEDTPNKEDVAVEKVLMQSRGQQQVPKSWGKYYNSPCYRQRQQQQSSE